MTLVTTFEEIARLLRTAERYDYLAERAQDDDARNLYRWLALVIRRRARLSISAL